MRAAVAHRQALSLALLRQLPQAGCHRGDAVPRLNVCEGWQYIGTQAQITAYLRLGGSNAHGL